MTKLQEKIFLIAVGKCNANLQMSFYDLEHYLTNGAIMKESEKVQLKVSMELFCNSCVEVCELIKKALEESE